MDAFRFHRDRNSRVNPIVNRLDILNKILRIQVDVGVLRKLIELGIQHPNDFRRSDGRRHAFVRSNRTTKNGRQSSQPNLLIADDCLGRLVPQNRNSVFSINIPRLLVNFSYRKGSKFRICPVFRIWCRKRPTKSNGIVVGLGIGIGEDPSCVFILEIIRLCLFPSWHHNCNRYDFLKAFNGTCNQCSMGPWAEFTTRRTNNVRKLTTGIDLRTQRRRLNPPCTGNVEMISMFFRRKPGSLLFKKKGNIKWVSIPWES